MKATTKVDYIIVGQGLAGSAVAVQLLKRGKKILVIDRKDENTSSKIAAGLFNPITGKFVKKTWLADKLFPYLHDFYREVEEKTGMSFFYPMPMYCPFLSVEEQNEWMAKSADPLLADYIGNIFIKRSVPGVKDDLGGLILKQCGHLDTVNYIRAVRAWICQKDVFQEEDFDFARLSVTDRTVEYKGYEASRLILCQGESALKNKWFDWLPVIPLKGETLTIRSKESPQQIINRGVYIVPAGKEEFKVGATYDFNDSERNITHKARVELEEKLRELIDFPYQIIEQKWSMRPTTPDRRPLLGIHPESTLMAIFNGLGTKGTSIAPYFSEVFIRWLENETDLNKEVNVNRYKSLYSKFTK